MAYDPNIDDCPELFETCLEPHPTLPGYVYTNNLGQEKFVPYPPDLNDDDQKVATALRQEAGVCYLDTFVDGVLCDSTDISSAILAKIPANASDLEWVAATCTFQWTNPQGNTEFFPIYQDLVAKLPINFDFDPATCVIKSTDINGICQSWNIGAAVAAKVRVEVDFDMDSCVLTFLGPQNQFQNWNIGQAVRAKIPQPSLTKLTQPDGSQQLVWDNGWGQTSVCNLTPIVLDTDGATLTSDGVLTLNYGGDGNPGSVVVDICQIVAQNCNSRFTQITPNSWEYIDNAGNLQTWTAPEVVTLFDKAGNPLVTGAEVLQAADFAASGAVPPQGAQLLGFGPNGQCVAYDVPPIPDQVTKQDIVEEFIAIPAMPAGSEFLILDADGNCRRAPFPTIPPEVFIGTSAPSKDDGYLVWFDPSTCVVKFCDDEGNWLEPRNVVCSATAPPCGKGYADIWFNQTEGCLYVCCEGVWISSDAQAVRSVIDAMCIQVGDGPAQALNVVDGKVVIPIPELPDYCIAIGDAAPIFPSLTGTDNKFAFNLPEYPEVLETCIRIAGVQAPIVPHLEDGKYYLDLPAYPEVTAPPTVVGAEDITVTPNVVNGVTTYTVSFSESLTGITSQPNDGTFTYIDENGDPTVVDVCALTAICRPVVTSGSSNVTVTPSTDGNGKTTYEVSVSETAIPELPEFCVVDKAGNSIPSTFDAATNKVTIALPPTLACQPSEPATDGSEGCFWYDGECLHTLCDGVWVAPDASATQA